MKFNLSAVLLAAALACYGCLVCYAFASCMTCSQPQEQTAQTAQNVAIDGMHFNVENVVEEFEDNGGCYILYTDPDAGLEDCAIEVGCCTYAEIIYAVSHNQPLVGTLRQFDDMPGVYCLYPEPQD